MEALSLSEPAIYVIKEEDIKVVCSGCLSRGRNLYPLTENVDLFMFFIGHHYVKSSEIFLCWECVAILRKIKQFQDRIWYAQKMLEQHIRLDDSVRSLSTLGIKKADTNQEVILEQENVRTNEKNSHQEIEQSLQENAEVIEEEQPKPILEFLEETAATEDNKLLLKEENDAEDYGIPEDFDDHEAVEANDVRKEEKNQKPKNDSEEIPNFIRIKDYKNKVKITKNDIDLTDVNKYFEDVVLTDEDSISSNVPGKVVSEEELARYKSQRVCKPCSQVFKTKLDANRHKTFAHYLKNIKQGGPHKCLECNMRQASLSSLRAHWQRHGAARCALCGLLARMRTDKRAQHLSTHMYRWACLLCPAAYNGRRDFLQHYRALHMYCQCDLCGARFRRKGKLILHVAFAHSARPGAPPPAADCDYCAECDKQYGTPALYRLHLKNSVQHNPKQKTKKSVPCPECGKVFSNASNMNRHRQLFHEKKTKHYCDKCDKYLVSGFTLRQHIEVVHHKVRQPRTKLCDLCGRGFHTNRILRHHRRTHTGERPHACAHCPAAFAQKWVLYSHERKQHNVTESRDRGAAGRRNRAAHQHIKVH